MGKQFGKLFVKFEVHSDNRRDRRLQNFVAIRRHRACRQLLFGFGGCAPNDPRRKTVRRCRAKFHQVPNALKLRLRYRRIEIPIVAAGFTEQLIKRGVV